MTFRYQSATLMGWMAMGLSVLALAGCGGQANTAKPSSSSSAADQSSTTSGSAGSGSSEPKIASTSDGERTELAGGEEHDDHDAFRKGADGLESQLADPAFPEDPVIPPSDLQ